MSNTDRISSTGTHTNDLGDAAGRLADRTQLPIPPVPNAPDGTDTTPNETDDITTSSEPSGTNFRVAGIVKVRDQFQPESTSRVLENPDLRELLSQKQPEQHAVMNFREADVTVLDLDNHSGKVTPEAVEAVMQGLPGWNLAHRTHRDGAHLFFMGEDHRERAVRAALEVPSGLEVELKQEGRHPLSEHSEAPGASAGPLLVGPGPEAGDPGLLDTGLRDAWLLERGMAVGGRYDHTRCPIQPSPTSGQPPVAVYETQVVCYRCRGEGHAVDGNPPGVYPFSRCGGVYRMMLDWARVPVHGGQVMPILSELLPHISSEILREAYGYCLEEALGPDSPLIAKARYQGSDLVLSESRRWLIVHDSVVVASDRPPEKLLSQLACVGSRYSADDANKGFKANPEKLAKAQMGVVPGYPLVRIVRPPIITPNPDPSTGAFLVPDPSRRQIRLLDDPVSWDECRSSLDVAFPGIDPDLLCAVLGGMFCMTARPGQPGILAIQGPTASGKTTTFRLASSMAGEPWEEFDITMEREKLSRCLGSACKSGQRLFIADEIDKDPLAKHLGKLLRIGSQVCMRGLYQDGQEAVDSSPFLVLSCISLPCFLADYDELNRRVRVFRLRRRVGDWGMTCGGRAERWCEQSEANRHLGNSVLTHSYHRAAAVDFSWDALADELGLGRLRDAETEARRRVALAELYEGCRNSVTPRVTEGRFRDGEWIFLLAVQHLVTQCVDIPDEASSRKQRRAIKAALESIDWNTALGIEDPDIACQVRSHGGVWVIRFVEMGCARGAERRNGQLPPAAVQNGGETSDG